MAQFASKITLKNGLWIALTLAIGSSGISAFAEDFVIEGGAAAGKEAGGAAGAGKAPVPAPGVAASISWEELKDRCLHPEQFDVQRPPQNLKLQCSEARVEFVPTPAGQIAISGSRSVVSTMLSDKFHVTAGALDLPSMAKPASCLRYKEVEKVLTLEKPMSCNEILGLKGDLGEYCTNALDRARGASPKLTQVRDTGRILDTCSASISGGEAGTPPSAPVAPGNSAGGGAGAK